MEINYDKVKTVEKYAHTIEEIVAAIRKQMTENEAHLTDDEIRELCEEIIFSSDLSYTATSDEMVLIVDSIVRRAINRYGILTDLLNDKDVNEIMVNGPEYIYVERLRKLERVDDAFTSEEELEEIIRMFASDVHREVNEAHPIVDARLPSGYRVNGVLKTVALNGPILTIRKFSDTDIEISDLIEYGSITEECATDLKALVRSGYNLFISGGTSSGKTTFLNALSASIGSKERVITIEDSAELTISHVENIVHLECRSANSIGKGEVSMEQLIRTSLRMRPDRIIVGEVRGREVIDMVQAMNTGHDGSMSTGHGNSIKGMLNRLETMYLMDSQVSINSVRNQIANAIDIFVHLRRDSRGHRKLEEVAELTGYDGESYILNYLYKANDNECLVRTDSPLRDRDRLIRAGYGSILT